MTEGNKTNERKTQPLAEIATKSEMQTRPFEKGGIVYFKTRIFDRCSIIEAETSNFQHAVLTHASGKGATFSEFDFRYAELEDCYFHGATFEKCDFTGAKIRRCNFRNATFSDCKFNYLTIEETPIDYRQITTQLPSWPNVAQEILQALRRNAVTLGEMKAVRKITLLEVEQEREHVRRALRREEAYYVKKYSTNTDKLRLWIRRIVLWLSSMLWGHGEKISRLLISCIASIAILSLVSTVADISNDNSLSFSQIRKDLWGYLAGNSLSVLGVSSTISPPQSIWIEAAVACLRIIFGGMLVAYIFRAISRR